MLHRGNNPLCQPTQNIPLASISDYISSLKKFRFAKVRFHLKAKTYCRLPAYLGSTIRGGLAWSLRNISCAVLDKDCADCILREQCAYSYIFETPLPKKDMERQGLKNAPHPIVLELPQQHPVDWAHGESLSFSLVLIDKAIPYFAFIVAAVEKMAERGLGVKRYPFQLASVEWQKAPEDWRTVWTYEDKNNLEEIEPRNISTLDQSYSNMNHLSLRFVTPARIVENGSLVIKPSFQVLIKALLWRFSTLLRFHCDVTFEAAFKELISEAAKIATAQDTLERASVFRWSNRKKTKMRLDGCTGIISYKGRDLGTFIPLIEAGRYVHVGKATIFGLGQYQMY